MMFRRRQNRLRPATHAVNVRSPGDARPAPASARSERAATRRLGPLAAGAEAPEDARLGMVPLARPATLLPDQRRPVSTAPAAPPPARHSTGALDPSISAPLQDRK